MSKRRSDIVDADDAEMNVEDLTGYESDVESELDPASVEGKNEDSRNENGISPSSRTPPTAKGQKKVVEILDDEQASNEEQMFASPKSKSFSQPDEPLSIGKKKPGQISKFLSAFLKPDRPRPKLEETPIIAPNDYILKQFGERTKSKEHFSQESDTSSSEDEADPPEHNEVNTRKESILSRLGNLSDDEVDVEEILSDSDEGEEERGVPGRPSKKRKRGTATVAMEEVVTPSKTGGRRGEPRRYFLEDLSTRCFRCGGIGHIAAECTNERKQSNCYTCGNAGHETGRCPNRLCFRCYAPGHAARECSDARFSMKGCKLCEGLDHYQDVCPFSNAEAYQKDMARVRCYTCNSFGHVSCAVVPSPTDAIRYCHNCASTEHKFVHCPEPSMDESLGINRAGWDRSSSSFGSRRSPGFRSLSGSRNGPRESFNARTVERSRGRGRGSRGGSRGGGSYSSSERDKARRDRFTRDSTRERVERGSTTSRENYRSRSDSNDTSAGRAGRDVDNHDWNRGRGGKGNFRGGRGSYRGRGAKGGDRRRDWGLEKSSYHGTNTKKQIPNSNRRER